MQGNQRVHAPLRVQFQLLLQFGIVFFHLKVSMAPPRQDGAGDDSARDCIFASIDCSACKPGSRQERFFNDADPGSGRLKDGLRVDASASQDIAGGAMRIFASRQQSIAMVKQFDVTCFRAQLQRISDT
jgi:hypothetical protein